MKEFAVWYFEGGCVLIAIVAGVAGYVASRYNRHVLIIGAVLALIVWAELMLWVKRRSEPVKDKDSFISRG